MADFFRFPHTPHLAWLGDGTPRDDKILSAAEAREFLSTPVLVEEKVDGANVGLSVSPDGELLAQNRGTYLEAATCHPQFKPLFRWMRARRDALADALWPHLILFGEWCYAVHSIHYMRLPDWFLSFDVYDRARNEFATVAARDAIAEKLDVAVVPKIAQGAFSLQELRRLLGSSSLTKGPLEGLILRREQGSHLLDRAKLVRPEFAQAIDDHWSRRSLKENSLDPSRARRH